MKKPTILIGGGYNKGGSFDEWTKLFLGRVKHLILIGETAEQIEISSQKQGFNEITICQTFQDAINLSYQLANVGDCVLLSPACASWGMFDNYEQRGNKFKEQVKLNLN